MAQFKPAYDITKRHEGGYVNDPRDKGGETYRGIARNFWPMWEGWKTIDLIPQADKKPNAFFDSAVLDAAVARFYLINFWDRYQLNRINSQAVANFMFDFAVNSGGAISQIQTVLKRVDAGIVVDGIVGNHTLSVINGLHESVLLPALVEQRAVYLQSLVSKGMLDNAFINGLISRVESFLPSKKKVLS